MHSVGSKGFQLSSSSLDDILQKIHLTHDPDCRLVDSEPLLQTMENVMSYANTSNGFGPHLEGMALENFRNIEIVDLTTKKEVAVSTTKDEVADATTKEVVGSHEALGQTINKISCKMQCKCSGEEDLQKRMMAIFELLGNYEWDAKVVIVLAAFATNYAEFWLIMQIYAQSHPLAVLVVMLKQLPYNLSAFKPQFKALTLLVKTMLDVTKCIIKFEGLPLQCVRLDDRTMVTVKSNIYTAAYWVIRSVLACSSQIRDFIAMKPEQVLSNSMTNAIWELLSSVLTLSNIGNDLRKEIDLCHPQIEAKLYQKLLDLFKDAHVDNQEVLRTLFALKDDLPLKDGYSQAKLGVTELANKEVLILVSKPEILPLEKLFLLVQQTYDHPHHNNLERHYEIIWVPISSSSRWSEAEAKDYYRLSTALPWYSIRLPWLLNSVVVDYIKREWHFVDEPLMVVLDSHGRVTSTNAIDMILIWGGPKAHPFSAAREIELWEEASLTMQLLMDEINPLVSETVEERTLCLYGSEDLEWIREFTSTIKKITSVRVQLQLVYVGKRDPNEHVRNILATIVEEKLSGYLSYPKIHFFWLRLECLRISKLKQGKSTDVVDHVLNEVVSLLSLEASENNWAVLGEGPSKEIIKIQGRKIIECLNLFDIWGEDLEEGFLGAVKKALEPPLFVEPCNHCDDDIIPYNEGSTEETRVCKKCKRQMEKHILYQCRGTE